MIRIGILGDIGSGKTFVAKNFDYPVFNADKEVSKLYKKDKIVYKKLKKILPKYFNSFPINKNDVSFAILDKKTNLTHYRISNDRDIITAAPMINFQHVGTNISLSDDQYEVFYNYSYNTWWKFSLFHCWKVSDHYMDVYYNRLLKHKWDSTNDPYDSDVDVISDDEKIK